MHVCPLRPTPSDALDGGGGRGMGMGWGVGGEKQVKKARWCHQQKPILITRICELDLTELCLEGM